jgi:stage V sporulation protein D (sporulation-specific penicillin-binding protein)
LNTIGRKPRQPLNKITILKIFVVGVASIIGIRLFFLQVIRYDFYQQVAAKEHYGETELPARRGEIFIKDYASGENVRVATNITLDTLYADPTIIKDKKLVADRLVPLIYDLPEARATDDQRIETEHKRAKTQEEVDKIKALTDEELYKKFYDDTLAKISMETRQSILLSDTLPTDTLKQIAALNMGGIEATEKELKAYPDKIVNKNYVASVLDKYLDISPSRLETILEGKNRYVILKKKIKPETSAQIQKIMDEDKDKNFFGIGLTEEYYRYYPENTLASNALGFVTPDGIGQYGIESKYNTQLQGKAGLFKAQKDGSVYGRQITVGDSVIQPAVDGDSIVLTIDRAMQLEVEKIIKKATIDYRADSGQAIVIDPKTGNIMAMAHYPDFDPNNFGMVLDTEEINFTEDEVKNLVPIEGEDNTFWFYRNLIAHDRYKVMAEILSNGQKIYKRYKNWIGLEAYQNKIASLPYEPGSVFKAITMASALDDKDVTPNTAFNDPGFLKVDFNKNINDYEYTIKNVLAKCTGYINMTNVIANSCNTGISYVAKQMGKSLFYSYMLKFGFGERTGIEFDGENPGKIAHFTTWAESEFYNHAFGQGITATPLQMAAAYGALANKGVLMQPHVVEQIIQANGKVVKTEPSAVQQVISEQAANTITAMLVNAVENGVAKNAMLPDHYLAGKTGTSQTYLNGKAMSGAGTTVASMAGYGPIDDPKFVILVKLDRPRSSEWADATAVYAFRDIAAYLYNYFGIPPDKK